MSSALLVNKFQLSSYWVEFATISQQEWCTKHNNPSRKMTNKVMYIGKLGKG